VNLYPFRETAAQARAHAARRDRADRHRRPVDAALGRQELRRVTVVVDPADYARVLAALGGDGDGSELRRDLAEKVYAHTAAYDAAIAGWFAGTARRALPGALPLAFERAQALRYGENPGQAAAFYTERAGAGLGASSQHGGKELSFNNLLDLEGAMLAIDPFGERDGVRDRQAHHALRPRHRQHARSRRIRRRSPATPSRRSAR
jgi:phosphoribosylaminoimidazolecarboxamide formyltransferase / IMP cyclohydrolase